MLGGVGILNLIGRIQWQEYTGVESCWKYNALHVPFFLPFLSPTKFLHLGFLVLCILLRPKKIFAMLCTNSLYFLVFVIYAFHVKHILMRKCCYMWLPRGSTTCWDLRVQITIILKLWIEIDNLIHAQSNIQKLK